jgi:hypothetical protein
MASQPQTALGYAWHGSGRHWDRGWLQLGGGAIGGFLIWYWGVKVPSTILDNPALSAIIAIAIGGLAGAMVVFVLRLCWWPFHKRLRPHGGLPVYLQKRLGARMWPVMLMILGLASFIILFGTGAIWFAFIGHPAGTTASRPFSQLPTPEYVQKKIDAVDRLDDAVAVLITRGVQSQTQDLRNSFGPFVRALDPDKIIERLSPLEDSESIFTDIDRIDRIYSTRFPELGYIVLNSPNYHEARSLSSNSRNLKRLVADWGKKPEMFSVIENTQQTNEWMKSAQALGGWIDKARSDLATKRREYEATEVYPAQ